MINHLYDNLKLIKDCHIGLPVEVLKGDTKAVVALRGESGKLFKAEPQLA